jgi:sodium-dependent phosphate transporter
VIGGPVEGTARADGSSSRVADTIRNKVVSVNFFEKEPAVLMLGMACALVASATFLTIATRFGLPVSTTYAFGFRGIMDGEH